MTKKPIYKRVWFWVVIVLILGAFGGGFGSKNQKTAKNASQTSSSKVSESSTKSSKASKKSVSSETKQEAKFKQIKIGMTKDQVIAILGQPTDQTDVMFYYGKDDIDFDSNGKVMDGSIGTLSEDADSQAKASAKTASKAAAKQKETANGLDSAARRFGTRSTDYLAKMPSTFRATDLGDKMQYGFRSQYGMLVRIDDANRMTRVYQYDPNAEGGLGKLLFTGRTIYQKTIYNFW